MIIRQLEICPRCGAAMPWRKYASRIVGGERRVYVKCRVCAKNEMVVYRERPHIVPKSGTNTKT